MNVVLFAAFLFIGVLITSLLLIKREDRTNVLALVCFAWVSLSLLLFLCNDSIPFTQDDDDVTYYLMTVSASSLDYDIFSMAKHAGYYDQPGYSFLLNLIFLIVEDSLYSFKLFNLALYVLLIPIWYRISYELKGSDFGKTTAVGVLFLFPLWYYTFFLLKDMMIVFLHSIFLLGIVYDVINARFRGIFLAFISTFLLIFFRIHLVIIHVLVFLCSYTLVSLRSVSQNKRVIANSVAMLIFFGILMVAASSDLLYSFGIESKNRVLFEHEMMTLGEQLGERSYINRMLFPLLYLLSETSGFNAGTWEQFDSKWLRGLLAIPWIIFGVPFFVMGIVSLLTDRKKVLEDVNLQNAWVVLFVFLAGYLMLSWIVGSTTRWRVADFPILGLLACYGWTNQNLKHKWYYLLLWWAFISAYFVLL